MLYLGKLPVINKQSVADTNTNRPLSRMRIPLGKGVEGDSYSQMEKSPVIQPISRPPVQFSARRPKPSDGSHRPSIHSSPADPSRRAFMVWTGGALLALAGCSTFTGKQSISSHPVSKKIPTPPPTAGAASVDVDWNYLDASSWAAPYLKKASDAWMSNYLSTQYTGMVQASDWLNDSNHTRLKDDLRTTIIKTASISEGQSYGMYMAALTKDETKFRDIWKWTQDNMQRKGDYLFDWWMGLDQDGHFYPLRHFNQSAGFSDATDGNELIAYSLLLADKQWPEYDYYIPAQNIIRAIAQYNIKNVNGTYYVASGRIGDKQKELTIYPGYLMPEVYRLFAEYDPDHADMWNKLASQDTYTVLEQCTQLGGGNVPNACVLDIESGNLTLASGDNGKFGFDSKRAFGHLSQTMALYPNQDKAKTYLSNHPYPQAYNAPSDQMLSLARRAQLGEINPKQAEQIYKTNLANLQTPNAGLWGENMDSYYDSALTWFALSTLATKRHALQS